MATTAKELESLVVRLVGEGSGYTRVLNDAVRRTGTAAKKIDKITAQQMGQQNHAMQEAARITQSLATPTQRYKQELAEVNQLHRSGALTTAIHTKAVRALRKEYNRGAHAVVAFGKGLTSAGRKMRGFGVMASLAVTAPVAGMIKSWASFDDAMTKSTAIMGDVTAELRAEMERTANTIARSSTTSAKDLAKSYFYLASAGMSAEQSIAALSTVEKFAVAGAFDMSTATDLLTDAQSALGLSSKDATKNMQGMLRVSDALVKANTLANATVEQFSSALTNEAGAAIKQYNMDLEEGIAILAAYADQGIKGNVAGSMLARMSRLLIKAINDNRGAFSDLNINVEEFATTGRNITEVIDGITNATRGMGPAQKAAALEALGFQARVQQTILPLLGLTDKIRGYQAELEKAGGTTKKVADNQLASFSSQMKILWNQITEVSREIGNQLAPYVKVLGDYIAKVTDWWRGLNDSTKKFIAIATGITAVLGPVAVGLGMVTIAAGSLTQVMGFLGIASAAALAPILIIMAKVAAITAVVVGVGYAIKEVIDYIWGPGSVSAAFGKLWGVTVKWAKGTVGFISNIGYNFKVLMEWLPRNWQGVVQDMVALAGHFALNLVHNIQVAIETIIRLFALWHGWMVGMFKKVFTLEFVKWVWAGIKKVGSVLIDFAAAAWEGLKSIFTGGGGRNALKGLIGTIVDDFSEGLNTEDVLASSGRILEEQAKKFRTTVEGFESSLEELPEFKIGVGIEVDKGGLGKGELEKRVRDAIKGVEPVLPSIKVPKVDMPEIDFGQNKTDVATAYETAHRQAILGVVSDVEKAVGTRSGKRLILFDLQRLEASRDVIKQVMDYYDKVAASGKAARLEQTKQSRIAAMVAHRAADAKRAVEAAAAATPEGRRKQAKENRIAKDAARTVARNQAILAAVRDVERAAGPRFSKRLALIDLEDLGATPEVMRQVADFYDKIAAKKEAIAASEKKAGESALQKSQMSLVSGWLRDVKQFEHGLLSPFEKAQKQVDQLNAALQSHLIGWDLYIRKVQQVQGELAAARGGSFAGPTGLIAGSAEAYKAANRAQIGAQRNTTDEKLRVLTLINKDQANNLGRIRRLLEDQEVQPIVTMGTGA